MNFARRIIRESAKAFIVTILSRLLDKSASPSIFASKKHDVLSSETQRRSWVFDSEGFNFLNGQMVA